MRRFNSVFILLIALGLLGACERKEPVVASGVTVRVGFIGPLTKEREGKGKMSLNGVETIMQMQPLLPNGDRVKLIVEDDGGTPELARKALTKLIEQDKVAAILIDSHSDTVIQATALSNSTETPIIALKATHPDITRNKSYVSQLVFDDEFQGTVAALFVSDELLVEKVAVFIDVSNAYSHYLGSEFVNKYESVGNKVVEVVSLGEKQLDYQETLERLRDQEVEFFYFPLDAKYVLEIVKAVDQLGWSVGMMGGDGLLASAMNTYPEEITRLDGIYVTEFFGGDKDDVSNALFALKAKKVYRSLFENKATTYTTLGAEGYAILYEAMARCEVSNDRNCINREIRSTRNFEGLMGRISIGSDGKAKRALFVNRIRNGNLDTIVKVY